MDLQRALDKTVLGLFQGKNSAFLTTIYCGMKFSWDESIPTACVDTLKRFRVNPTWFMTLTDRSKVALFAHELWHMAWMHLLRVDGRDHRIWNAACDHAINLMLLDHGYHFDMPGLYDPRFKYMTADQIYDILLSEAIPGNPTYLPFGEDFAPADPASDEDDRTPEAIEADISSLVVRAATAERMSNAAGAGNLPGDFSTMLEKLLRPKIRWERLFERWMLERSEVGSDWRRPNRRFEDMYLPSRGSEDGLTHMVYGIDASGSMTDQHLLIINSELKGVKETYNPSRMTLVSFDEQIQDVWEYSSDDGLEALEIHGRGGTDMDEIFDYVRNVKPDVFVMFSDMDCEIPEAVPGVAMLWVCFDDPNWVPPYGDVIHVDSRTPTTA